MKAIGALEVAGWLLLWLSPKLGGFILAGVMAGALHLHLTVLGDKPEALGLQFALLVASLFVFLFDSPSSKEGKKKTSSVFFMGTGEKIDGRRGEDVMVVSAL